MLTWLCHQQRKDVESRFLCALLRKNVPTEAQGADIKDIMKDMPGKKFEKQRAKIIEKIKKINY